jgi:hypothetical protein
VAAGAKVAGMVNTREEVKGYLLGVQGLTDPAGDPAFIGQPVLVRAGKVWFLDGLGNLVIGISGTVSPPLGTTTGSYTGTVSMTVTY